MKISEALAAYRVLARAEGRSPRTIGWITSSVGYFSQFLGQDMEADRVTANDLRRFIIAYLASVTLLDEWIAITVSATITVFIALLRLIFRSGLRGVTGTHSAQAWAEITYPLAGTLGLVVGWGILGDKWLAFVPIAFMAWGDTASGLVRDTTSGNRSPSLVSMSAMLIVCVGVVAIFFRPLWIGVAGGAVATLAERYRPGILGFWDDNIYIVATSLAVMAVLAKTLA